MPRPEKVKTVEELKEKFAEAKGILLTDFTGLNVEEISDLRNKLREAAVEYRVVKNTLARISVEELGLKDLLNLLDGPTAIAFGVEDPIAPVKIVSEFAKKSEKPKIKAYLLEGQLFQGEEVKELAKLPEQKVLLTQLLGTISAPVSNLVYLLQNLLQQTVYVINAIKEKKEQEG